MASLARMRLEQGGDRQTVGRKPHCGMEVHEEMGHPAARTRHKPRLAPVMNRTLYFSRQHLLFFFPLPQGLGRGCSTNRLVYRLFARTG